MNYINGDKALRKKLDSLAKKDSKKAILKGTRAGCKIVAAKVKSDMPVVTGMSRRAVKVRAMRRSRKGFGTCVSVGEKNYQGKTFYWAFVEWGHAIGKRKGGHKKGSAESGENSGRKKIPGQFIMKHAADSAADEALRVALDTIKQEIEKVMAI